MALIPHDPALDRAAVAYKEWAGICRALEEGRQTVLLRKGGIAEAGGVFRPEYSAFSLFPTYVHQAEQGLRDGYGADRPRGDGAIALTAMAIVESVAWLDRLADVERLRDFHVWTGETVAKRFDYRTPGLWVLGVRIYRRRNPWVVPFDPAHAGCKTWVKLAPEPEPSPLTPALADEMALWRRGELLAALGRTRPAPTADVPPTGMT